MATRAQSSGFIELRSYPVTRFISISDDDKTYQFTLSIFCYAKGGKDSITEFDAQGVWGKMGVTPHQVIDYKALCGDKSDCIPGFEDRGQNDGDQVASWIP